MVRYRYRILSYSFLGIDTNGMSFILDFYQISYHVYIINPILVVLETIFWSGCLLYTNHQKLKTCQTEGTGFSQGCTPRWSNPVEYQYFDKWSWKFNISTCIPKIIYISFQFVLKMLNLLTAEEPNQEKEIWSTAATLYR